MLAEKRELEVRGDDVEKAVEVGLAQLGLSRDGVTIEVLDEGSSGFLGIGSRDAIVRLKVIAAEPEPIQEEAAESSDSGSDVAETAVESTSEESSSTTPGEPDDVPVVEGDTALEIINTLLDKMQVEAQTSKRLSEPDDLTGERRWVVDIEGNDLGVLIGPRGDTLNALQYVSRLMTGHQLHQRPNFIVDIEGYRSRREQALARLAERMAKKVESRGKALSLEPMPPNERRIIHMTLRNSESVITQSQGEGSRRQVRILPKRK
jgi:spoIIIJ-associated protein